jgi:hypothetical protein
LELDDFLDELCVTLANERSKAFNRKERKDLAKGAKTKE